MINDTRLSKFNVSIKPNKDYIITYFKDIDNKTLNDCYNKSFDNPNDKLHSKNSVLQGFIDKRDS